MAYTSLVTKEFYDTPWLGTLPVVLDVPKHYDLKKYIPASDLPKVSEVLVYVFFTGVPHPVPEGAPIVRAVYELYTGGDNVLPPPPRYSQLMNAIFNQRDTVINSANLWFPYTSDGTLKARIPAAWLSEKIPDDAVASEKHSFKNLDEAMKAYASAKSPYFLDLFLLGYRLKE